ncbi:MAG: helix-turn-helix domain-containing protein [Firmicutes bacterium]|nr:helix-turn-helix domain-containing protein [Bacillota bacterium]
MNQFKERLKELRAERSLKQSEVARELNIQEPTYSSWEQGRREPNIDTILRLAEFFDVTVGQLLGSEDLYV